MKRRFTILTAALALLVFIAPSMVSWGQDTQTVTLNIASYAEAHNWADATQYNEAFVSPVTFTAAGGGNTGKYYTNGQNWRFYQNEQATLTISIHDDFSLASITPTFTNSNNGTLLYGSTALTSGNEVSVSGTSVMFSVGNSGSATNGQIRITEIVVAYTAAGDTPVPTTYTVTYDCNGGTSGCPQNVTGIEPNTQIQLADAPSKDGFDFAGWNDGTTTYGENEDYTVNGNVTFTAQWTENTIPGGETATLNIQDYAEDNGWENGEQYTTATVAPVTFTANGGGNTGKYYTNGQDWRFYQGENASITISIAEGYTLVSVKPTYTVNNGGVLKNGNATIESGTTVSVSGTSVTFTVGNSGTATNGQVRFTNIDVVYVSDGGTQTSSDLAITNQSTDLAFDLYNNTTAQVINYTTSSTGAITITPAESDYFSYVHDATAKTITVTPTAVTPSVQTVTISQAADDDYYAGTATFTVSVANSDPNLPGTENNPYTVAQARAAIDAGTGTQGVYATGIVSAIPTAYNSSFGNVTFNMVDEEGDEVFLQAYRCGGDEAANVAVGDVVVVYGNLTYHAASGTYEFGQGCEVVSLTHPVMPRITVTPATLDVDAGEHLVNYLDLAYENIEVEGASSFTVHYYDAEGEEIEPVQGEIWMTAGVAKPEDAYQVICTIIANEGAARTAYFKVSCGETYSNLVTVNQAAYVPTPGDGDYVRISSLDQLTNGSIVVIATRYDENASNYRAMKNTISNGKASSVAFESTTSGSNEVLPSTIVNDVNDYYWVVSVNNGVYTFTNANGAVIGWGSSTNFNMNGNNTTWNVEEATSGDALVSSYAGFTIQNVTDDSRYIAYRGSTEVFGPYSSSNMTANDYNFFLDFFVQSDEAPVTETYTLDIDGFAEGSDGGYYLIASPVTVDLTNHDMTTGDFDLYYFDNAQDDEWRNYRQEAFNLVPGKGYLYAKKATDDNPTYSFELTGVPYNGNGDVELTYTENADFAGFNLIGNPFNTNATLNMPYYRLNENGSALNTSTESSQINLMEGVFVQATPDNSTAHFSAVGSKMISQLNVKVTRNRGAVLDNAIIRFDNGAMLGKFQLNPNSTKVYITEGNEDYAIVRSASESEMPVSFKAAENGTYTLSVVAENVEMNYLHLIDNMTGAEVDLLATPSYSFEANTTDYANRFRLVFNANGLEENSNFAFFNGSEWVVSNMGDATLQVIDMTGRVISSETVNGNVTFSTNGLTAGVYMMRLVNGNDVKTQKVLVK